MGFFSDLGGALTGGLIGTDFASDAADAQQEGIQAGDSRIVGGLENVRNLLQPNVDAGNATRNKLLDILGLSSPDQQQQAFDNFQATPGFQFALEQGAQAVDRSGAARGQLNSGATLKALQERGVGLANQQFQQNTGNLLNFLGTGTNATNNLVGAESTAASNRANLAVGGGNAQAQGIIGRGNAIGQGINNLVSLTSQAATGGFGKTVEGFF